MKKFLFIFMGVLSFFFFSDSVSALTFDVNGTETEVTENNAIDYFYTLAPNIFDLDIKNYAFFYDTTGTNNNLITFMYSLSDSCFSSTSASSVSSTFPHLISSTFYFRIKANCTHSWVYVSHSGEYTVYRDNHTIFQTETTSFSSGNALLFSDFGLYNYPSTPFADLKQNINSKPTLYTITYYVNNEVYKTVEVEEGSSYQLLEYTPPKNYKFNGWEYDETIDFSNVTSDINIYGTTSYVRPSINYSEEIDSVIHELSVSIIGKNVPVEFDYIYTVMDFIILLVLVFCVVMPFVIIIKLLSGRW